MGDIISVINTLAQNLYSAIEKEVFVALDNLLIIQKDILKAEPLKRLSITSDSNSIILLAICFTTIAGICFGLRKMMGMYKGESNIDIMQFILRLIACSILSVYSWYICETLLDINSMISDVIQSIGHDIVGSKINFDTLKNIISNMKPDENFLSLDGAITGMVGFGATTLLFTFCIRYFMTIFLIIVAPISFMLAIDKNTYGIFCRWFKAFIANITIQNIALVFMIIPLSIKDTDNVMFKVVLVGSIYSLYKINDFVKGIVSHMSLEGKQ